MKIYKRVLTVVLCFILISVMSVSKNISVNAADGSTSTCVGLGDSIVSGYGLESFNSNDSKNKTSSKNFVNKLSLKLGKKAVNLGVEGLNSTQLLQSISNPKSDDQKAIMAEIKKAGIITISIGGNNVFVPILNAVDSKLPAGKKIFNASAMEIQLAALSLIFDQDAMKELQNTVAVTASNFIGDDAAKKTGEFDSIVAQVKKLNPKAQIVVLTIYNPYRNLLPDSFNAAINSMNARIIKSSANGRNYKIADVYSAFEKADKETILVNSASGNSFDPHPTARGHEVIYTLVSYAVQNNTLPYKVKNLVIRGKLTMSISEGNLVLTVTPAKGYSLPQYIGITVGNSARKALTVTNGTATIPIAEINTDFVIAGVCRKAK